jgi:hypothetical protein
MTLPLHISCNSPAAALYELADGRFQKISGGPVAPFIVGPRYVLVEEPLAKYLQELLIPNIEIVRAVVWDRASNVEIRTHWQVKIGQWFSADQIKDLDLNGERLLVLNDEHVFCSPALGRLLKDGGFPYLRFREGLEWFAGN